MKHIEKIPSDFEPFARQLCEAIAEASRLPAGDIRDGLLLQLTKLMELTANPLVVVRNEDRL